MNRKLDGKFIQPKDLTPDVYDGLSIVENIVLASSNRLRKFLDLQATDTLPGPIPRFIVRKNSSLDNYFADLLLRTCYAPVDYLPPYEEHVIRGSQKELPSDLNPRLVGAVLIGIGGMSNNPDFIKAYDEHSEHGTRTAASASAVVFHEHLERFSNYPGVQSLNPIREEISDKDSAGRTSYDDIFTITKNLHAAQFRHPGFVSEPLEPQWKRAIVEAVLMSICVSVNEFEDFDDQKALISLEREWDLYLKKAEKLAQSGYTDHMDPSGVAHVMETILKPTITLFRGKPSYFTHRRILFALQKVWHPLIVSFIMGFLFEATLQAQDSFVKIKNKTIPMRIFSGNYAFIYYQKEPLDRLPQRGILANMNEKKKKTLLVLYDPARQITSIFRNNHFPYEKWRKFCELLTQKEGDDVWYTPTGNEGKIANFILNGTESFVGVEMTQLSEEDLLSLFKSAIGQ